MLRVIIVSVFSLLLTVGCGGGSDASGSAEQESGNNDSTESLVPENELSNSDSVIKDAFLNEVSDLQVDGKGSVIKLLPDDVEGDKHQRFIIQLDSEQTLLVAHNIDLAPKIDNLKNGDVIEFYGEYEWNEEGGVIHWTHFDPSGNHIDGWLKHNDIIYQ